MRGRIGFLLAAGSLVCPGQTPEVTFETQVRLVEVYATVLDQRGRYLEGLERERFRVTDNGQPQPITAFEASSADLSCAILLDTTGSMARAMPVVKNAILKLLDELRPSDAAALYSFSNRLEALEGFTTDRQALKNALLRTRPAGRTALFDALAQVARELARRNGKKVLVLFTDGQDNASVLNAEAAMNRARRVGVPVYAVAQGEALQSPALVRQLRQIARRTGGMAYEVRRPNDIEKVFADISRDLRHTYMLAYQAPSGERGKWRAIQVEVSGLAGYRLRAREGYWPD
jgi:VWFA-related protein